MATRSCPYCGKEQPEGVKKCTRCGESMEEPRRKRMFLHPLSFHGRIRRKEYWLTIPMYIFAMVVMGLLTELLIPTNMEIDDMSTRQKIIYFIWFAVAVMVTFTFPLAQSVKRSHDLGNSGWWVIAPFYPLILLLMGGDKVKNIYGDAPK